MDATTLLDLYRARSLRIATAESCTGGMIAAAITDIAGSSDVFERGFVTYSNEAKTELIKVPAGVIQRHGAVSEAVARAMAAGALESSRADIAVSVTGVAGPGGGTAAKPVGLVHFGGAQRNKMTIHREIRLGNIGRRAIRLAAVAEAFGLVRALLD